MKFRTLTTVVLAWLLANAATIRLFAQEHGQHHHYKLIDMGLKSYINGLEYYGPVQNLNAAGTLIGWADTSTPDPYAPNCFTGDCLVTHGFQWPNYVQPDLQALPNGESSAAHWVSANGLIAGSSQNGQTDPLFQGFPIVHAVRWKNGRPLDLGTLPVTTQDPEGGYYSGAHSVNSHGQVVGWALNTVADQNSLELWGEFFDSYAPYPYPYQTRAFLWENGVMKDLGTLSTGNDIGTDAMGFAINEAGQIIGISYTGTALSPVVTRCTYTYAGAGGNTPTRLPTQDPFLWENGQMIDLKGFGGTCGWPRDINNHGQVVGSSDLSGDTVMHPFLWTKTGGMQDLLKGSTTFTGAWGLAIKINESGQVVGWANLAGDTQTDAFLWDGKLHDLGRIDDCAHAWWINAKGQVIGHWGIYVGGDSPYLGNGSCVTGSFLWENGGPMVDLARLIIPSNSGISVGAGAFDINDRGEIAGAGADANGNSHAVLLIPCDENHPDVEGCDYSMVESDAVSNVEPLGVEKSTTLNSNDHSRQIGDATARPFLRRGKQ